MIFFIYIFLGYWKENANSTKLYSCTPRSDSCLFSLPTPYTICENGYIGPLCQTCDAYHSKYVANACYTCYSEKVSYILFCLIALCFMIVLAIYIK